MHYNHYLQYIKLANAHRMLSYFPFQLQKPRLSQNVIPVLKMRTINNKPVSLKPVNQTNPVLSSRTGFGVCF